MDNEKQTVKELNEEIQRLLVEIESLSSQLGIENPFKFTQDNNMDLEKENDRIEKYLSDFTHREGVLLTIAGLFSLFPLFDIRETLPYFLTWVIPFFLIAITFYILSSKRLHIISQNVSTSLDPWEINKALRQQYFGVMRFHRITDASLVSFFASFVANYYWWVFMGSPKLSVSLFLVALSVILGGARYYYASKLGKGSSPEMIAVGMPVPTTPPPISPPGIPDGQKGEDLDNNGSASKNQ